MVDACGLVGPHFQPWSSAIMVLVAMNELCRLFPVHPATIPICSIVVQKCMLTMRKIGIKGAVFWNWQDDCLGSVGKDIIRPRLLTSPFFMPYFRANDVAHVC